MKNKINISSPDKILFPKDKVTKLDVINYYIDISELMFPFIKNRILSVIRCHENIDKETFFKKHASNDKNHVNIININGEEYFYLDKKLQLIYQVQNGSLEFHISGSGIKKLDNPNMMVFDLDPDEGLSLLKLRKGVEKVKEVLDQLNLISFLKTSGGKGYHIVIPFQESIDYDKFYSLSKNIALVIESKYPKIFTTNLKKNNRKDKIFIDYLRNNQSSTCVAPYSLRVRDKAPISFPIEWDDLYKIKPNEINIKNYKKYLNSSWDNYFKIKQKFKKAK